MTNWKCIASVEDVPAGTARELVVGQRIVALFNVDGQYYALDGVCPHQGGPLGSGTLSGCIVTCPWHGWQFDVTTGQHQTRASMVHTQFPVKTDGGSIFVDVGPDDS